METIDKTICINGFKRHDFGKSPCIDGESRWDGIAMDYIIDTNSADAWVVELENIIPLVESREEGKYILRYGNARDFYTYLSDFSKDCMFYELCFRNGEKRWVERFGFDIFSENFSYTDGLYSELPDIEEEWEVGEKHITYNINADAFNELFTGYTFSEAVELCRNFRKLVETVFFNGDSYYTKYCTPYTDLHLFLEQTIADEGMLIPYVENWVPKKTYLINSIVFNQKYGKYYKLGGGDKVVKIQVTPNLYDIFNEGWELLDEGDDNTVLSDSGQTNFYCEDSEGNYFIHVAAYSGKFNEATNETEFDEIVDGEFVHWKEIEMGGGSADCTATSASRLGDFTRKKSFYDNEGNELPFILTENGCELKYLLKTPYNIKDTEDEEIKTCSIITDIYVEGAEDSGITIIGSSVVPNYNTPEEGTIVFKYLIDCQLRNNVVVSHTGIEYVDKYPYAKVEYNDLNNNEITTLYYFNIDYNGTVYDETGVPVINSQLTFYGLPTEFYSGHTYSDESLFGIQEINLPSEDELSTLEIERGTSSLFEKMDYLSMSRSIEDMEKFRNDYFSIKED